MWDIVYVIPSIRYHGTLLEDTIGVNSVTKRHFCRHQVHSSSCDMRNEDIINATTTWMKQAKSTVSLVIEAALKLYSHTVSVFAGR